MPPFSKYQLGSLELGSKAGIMKRCAGLHISRVGLGGWALLGRGTRSVSSIVERHRQFLELVRDHGEVEGLGYICLDNPKTKNAMSGRMMHDFALAIGEASSAITGPSKLRCLVLHGKNGAFCAGADFSLARDVLTTPELGLAMCKFMTDATNQLLTLPAISAAVIDGPAMGGGAELTTACDFRLMTQSGFVQFVHAKMGVSPGWGGAGRLVRLVGRRKALQLLGGSVKMDASTAEQFGYLDGSIAAEGLEEELQKFFAPYLSQKHAGAVHAIKRAIHAADIMTPEAAQHEEMAAFASRWGGEDNKQALQKR